MLLPVGTSGLKGSPAGEEKEESSFKEILKAKLEEVALLQARADQLAQGYLTGEIEDIHTVILAAEEANLALQLTVQLRNKIVEAYQEISRMQL